MYIFDNALQRTEQPTIDSEFNTQPFFLWENGLDDPSLLEYLDNFKGEWTPAIVGEGEVNPKIRKHTTADIEYNINTRPLFESLRKLIESVNFFHYNFVLWSMDDIQTCKFEKGDFFIMHNDRSILKDRSERKLTVIVGLSRTEDSKGGKVVVSPYASSKHKVDVMLNKGDVLVFPSWVPYEIKPVEEGTANFLLTWVYGPKFI